jgi:hypothetical protein
MKRIGSVAATLVCVVFVAVGSGRKPSDDPHGLTVHEWGTFTSIAGEDGKAITWMPWGGPTDLPCFVDRFNNTGLKAGYSSTVRMETPVLYFYSPREMKVNASVRFRHGLITEWYPQATVTPKDGLVNLASPGFQSSVSWSEVKVHPKGTDTLPQEKRSSHYYAARQTDAATLQVGAQKEKFLFYRGVASFELPISAGMTPEGKVVVKSLSGEEIPEVILFESRGGKLGYRMATRVDLQEFAPPSLASDFASLKKDFERVLVSEGLFPREAAAMVETWRDSWFEEGMRLFYVVPGNAVDSVLPLQVTPKPSRIARVFIGRMELVTPVTLDQVRTALVSNDRATLEKYGRFLEPISRQLLPKMSALERANAQAISGSVSAAYLDHLAVCK